MYSVIGIWLLSLMSWYLDLSNAALKSVLGASQCIYCKNNKEILLVEEMPSQTFA